MYSYTTDTVSVAGSAANEQRRIQNISRASPVSRI